MKVSVVSVIADTPVNDSIRDIIPAINPTLNHNECESERSGAELK